MRMADTGLIRAAFRAGSDGLDAYRAVVPMLAGVSPVAAAEVGVGQAAAVGELLRDAGFNEVEVRRDLAAIERVVVGRR